MDQMTLGDRKRLYLNEEGADKPLKSPVPHDVVVDARRYRIGRVREYLAKYDCAAALLYDPVNIRYAFDCTNMQVWTMHNPIRYAVIHTTGPGVMYEFKHCFHLSDGREAVDEVRGAIAWNFMFAGDRVDEATKRWAAEIADEVRRHGGGNMRVAADKLDPHGARALEAEGLEVIDGMEVMELARSIKSDDELQLMRWTIRVAEAGMARLYEHSVPGVTEQELWAHLHFENARSGGDWMETKLVTCGPNTNPWYQECSDRPCQEGEMISFDTDMVGPYGYCADISRSWTCGYTPMNDTQRRLYRTAREQIEHNLGILRAGMTLAEFNEQSWRIPDRHVDYRYTVVAHGCGLCDEWPSILPHTDFHMNANAVLEKNMVMCVESLIAEAGTESVKLETQVVLTETGCERLDTFPWETV